METGTWWIVAVRPPSNPAQELRNASSDDARTVPSLSTVVALRDAGGCCQVAATTGASGSRRSHSTICV